MSSSSPTEVPIVIADHNPLVLGPVETAPTSSTQLSPSSNLPPLPPRKASSFQQASPISRQADTSISSPLSNPSEQNSAHDAIPPSPSVPRPTTFVSSTSPTSTSGSTPSRATKPGPPALPPRPTSIKRLRSDLIFPLEASHNPLSAFKDDYMESAALAARDNVLLEELERKNRQKEYELERQRIVPGLDNSDLIALVRSFDKQVYNVHLCPEPYDGAIPHGLDLQPNPNEEFTVDKMRSCLERIYSSIIVGMIRFLSEVQRIRNWEEGGRRTLVALAVYSYAWIADLIITSFLLFLATLVLSPRARKFCFSAPLQAKHPKPTSDKPVKIEAPQAPHRTETWGPAASEEKAADWANTVIDLMKATALPKETTNDGVQEVKDTADREINGVMVKDMKKRGETGEKEAKEKSKKELAIDLYGQPTMRVLAGLADKWERIANALNPTPPFALEPRRVEVFCYMIAPLLIVSTFVTERMVSKAFGIIFGFLLFGQPVIDYTLEILNQIDPAWKEKLILENNILSDVPTNAQLIFRLLRDAEHRQKPLQRPMSDFDQQSDGEDEEEEDDDEDEYEQDDESENDEGADNIAEAISGAAEGGKKKKAGEMLGKVKSKVGARARARKAWDKAGHLKEEGFALLSGHKKIDLESRAEKIMDKLNIHKESKPARAILNRLPKPPKDSPDAPSRFYVYHPKHGPGHLIIYPPTIPLSHTDAFVPARVRFTTVRNVPAEQNVSLAQDVQPFKGDLIVSINDIVGLKKHGSSWPTRIATSWALDVSGAGGTGLEVSFVRRNAKEAVQTTPGAPSVAEGKEESIKFNGIVRRNELFGRLLSAGEQRWEMF